MFCLEHRSYTTHKCPAANTKDHRAVSCPLCARTIFFVDGQDVNDQFRIHRATNCTPETRVERVEKKRCAAPGCREKLLLSNKTTCSSCRQELCLAHRHAEEHNCRGASAAVKSSWLGQTFAKPNTPKAVAPRPAPPAAAARPSPTISGVRPIPVAPASAALPASAAATGQSNRGAKLPPRISGAAAAAADPGNSLRGTVSRRARPTDNQPQLQLQPQTPLSTLSSSTSSSHSDAASDRSTSSRTPMAATAAFFGGLVGGILGSQPFSSSSSSTVGGGSTPRASTHDRSDVASGIERCPQCGATFADVGLLVSHVEQGHPAPGARFRGDMPPAALSSSAFQHPPDGSAVGLEPCPVCGAAFDDASSLVSHVTSAHRGYAAALSSRSAGAAAAGSGVGEDRNRDGCTIL